MVKIIFGTPRDVIVEHARKVVVDSQKKRENPFGIAEHTARTPIVCDDCGESHWIRADLYYLPHVGCKVGKGQTGF